MQAVQQILHAKTAMQNSLASASYAGLDYIGALEVLEQLKESCDTKHVLSLTAVGGLADYMKGVETALKNMMMADLVEKTMLDANKCVTEVLSDVKTTSNGGGLAAEGGDELLGPIVASLCKINSLNEALHAVQKDLHRGMRNLIA